MTVVVDASAIVDLLVDSPQGRAVGQQLRTAEEVFAPDLLLVEVACALWRLERGGALTSDVSERAMDDLITLPIDYVPQLGLIPAAWALRTSVRIADGFYVALAQELRAPLMTTDLRLARGATDIAVITVS